MSFVVSALVFGCERTPAAQAEALTLTHTPDAIIAWAFGSPGIQVSYREATADGYQNPQLASAMQRLRRPLLRVRVDGAVRFGDVCSSLYTAQHLELRDWTFVVDDGDQRREIVVGAPESATIDDQLMWAHRHRGCWNLTFNIGPDTLKTSAFMEPWPSVEQGTRIGPARVFSAYGDPNTIELEPSPEDPTIRAEIPVAWTRGGPVFDDVDGWLDAHGTPCPNAVVSVDDATPWARVEPVMAYLGRRNMRPIVEQAPRLI